MYYFTLEDLIFNTFNKQPLLDFSGVREGIEQFTGLHDKNGKEIYENSDRVKVVIILNELNQSIKREFVSTVVFCEHSGCYIFPDYYNVSVDDAREGDEMISFEVIGNIHENPELING